MKNVWYENCEPWITELPAYFWMVTACDHSRRS